MKKSLIIFTLVAFFATGMIAQDASKDKKECTKTEMKADCPAAKDKACTQNKDAKCCAEKSADKKACDQKTAEKKDCCANKK
ncbi:hypothetical protein MASR2M117_04630 [Paludibacter sp.]